MKRTILALTAAAASAAALATTASAGAPAGASLLIRHETKGCHAWALNGGAFQVSQTVRLKRGGWLAIENTDVMSHQLLKLSGGSVALRLVNAGSPGSGKLKAPYAPGLMPHMKATLRVAFPKTGVYTFTTKEGNDYFPGVKTVGNDNVLRLKVIVA